MAEGADVKMVAQAGKAKDRSTELVIATGVAQVMQYVTRHAPVLFMALPKMLWKRATANVGLAVRAQPKLCECTMKSIAAAASQAASLNLSIGFGPMAQAYIVPFNERATGNVIATLVIGYRGLIELGVRSGRIKNWTAKVVREGDLFTYEDGLDPVCKHVPSRDTARKSKPVTHVYFSARLASGGAVVEVRTVEEVIEHAKKHCKTWDRSDSKWKTSWDKMAEIQLIRAAFQSGKMPMAVEAESFGLEDDSIVDSFSDDDITGEIIDTTFTVGGEE